jgi:hypothetical protein
MHDPTRPVVMQEAGHKVSTAKLPQLAPFRPAVRRNAAVAPAATGPGSREVFGFATADASFGDSGIGYPSWNYGILSTIAFFGLHVNNDGSLAHDSGWNVWNSSQFSDMLGRAHSSGDRVVVTIILQDFSAGTPNMCAGLSNAQTTINQAVSEMQAKGVDGINVDYEGLGGTCGGQSRAMMTSFVQRLGSAMPAGS